MTIYCAKAAQSKSKMNCSNNWNVSCSTQDYTNATLIRGIISWTCAVVGIIGNVVVILVYSSIDKMQKRDGGKDYKTHVRYYIPMLAVLDLVTLILAASRDLIHKNVWLCKGHTFLILSTIRASGLILLLITIQRFMYISLFPKRILSIKQLRILLTVPIGGGAIATLPDAFLIKYTTETYVRYVNETAWRIINETIVNIEKTEVYFNDTDVRPIDQKVYQSICHFSRSSAEKAVNLASFVIMLLIIFVVICLYTRILQILLTKLRRQTHVHELTASHETVHGIESQAVRRGIDIVNKNNGTDANSEFADVCNEENQQRQGKAVFKTTQLNAERNIQRQKAKLKFIVMVLIIVIFYGASYIPIHVIALVEIDKNASTEELKAQTFLQGVLWLFVYMDHIINPFIYGCFDAIFREKCKEILCRNRCN